MKYYKQVLALLALLVFFSASVIAQEEISTEEWEAEIARLSSEKADLTAELEGLQAEVNALGEKKNSLQAFEDCQGEMYAMVGADADAVADYSAKVNALMADISAKKSEKADRQAELDALKASKLSALPGFYDLVHGKLQKCLMLGKKLQKKLCMKLYVAIIFGELRKRVNIMEMVMLGLIFIMPTEIKLKIQT